MRWISGLSGTIRPASSGSIRTDTSKCRKLYTAAFRYWNLVLYLLLQDKHLIISVEGHEKSGKSTFGYTGPLPIVSFSLDMGHERALYGSQHKKWFEGLEIQVVKYDRTLKAEDPTADVTVYELPNPIQLNAEKLIGYEEQWDYFIDRYVKAMTGNVVKTVIVDTMTLARQHKIKAYLQELQGQGKARKQLQQIEYGHPDGEVRDLYTFAKAAGKNLVAVHHLRDHYAPAINRDGVVTTAADGTFEIDGVRDTAKYVDVAIRMVKNKGVLTGEIQICGPDLSFEGSSLPNISWDSLINMISINWSGTPFPRRKEILSAK
jgi:hypothetical protein